MDTATLMETLKQPLWQYYLSAALAVLPAFRIFHRAGQPPWLALLLFIPWAGIPLAMCVLAFRAWPNVVPRQKREKKEKHA